MDEWLARVIREAWSKVPIFAKLTPAEQATLVKATIDDALEVK